MPSSSQTEEDDASLESEEEESEEEEDEEDEEDEEEADLEKQADTFIAISAFKGEQDGDLTVQVTKHEQTVVL